MNHEGEPAPRVVQLAGADSDALALAARINVDLGAQIIDINMGCPAKKVCGRLCGSALLQDESLVARILEAVVRAVNVPVTLKIRTGWDRGAQKNALRIARLAEAAASQRWPCTGARARDFYRALPSTTRSARSSPQVAMPLFANGDVEGRKKRARYLISLAQTE